MQLQHCAHVEVCLLQPLSRSSLDKSLQGKDYFGARNVAGVGFSPLLTAGAAEDTINTEGMPFVTQTIWQSYASLLREKHPLCSTSPPLYAQELPDIKENFNGKFMWMQGHAGARVLPSQGAWAPWVVWWAAGQQLRAPVMSACWPDLEATM